jgi:hypothetical protein
MAQRASAKRKAPAKRKAAPARKQKKHYLGKQNGAGHYGGTPAPIEEGSNSAGDNEVQEYFDRVHELTDSMESMGGKARADIKEVWDEAADQLGFTKTSLKFMFTEQRRARKTARSF